MPLTHQWKEQGETVLCVWEISEPESFFLEAMAWEPEVLSEIMAIKSSRRIESLAARVALHTLTARPEPWSVRKDEHQKPIFVDRSDWHCSLSHSHQTVAAILSRSSCGIDLQLYTDKMPRIVHKFLHEQELECILSSKDAMMRMHEAWCAKEALYKVYGLREVDFRKHLHLELDGDGKMKHGEIRKGDVSMRCQMGCVWLENQYGMYCLVWAVQTPLK